VSLILTLDWVWLFFKFIYIIKFIFDVQKVKDEVNVGYHIKLYQSYVKHALKRVLQPHLTLEIQQDSNKKNTTGSSVTIKIQWNCQHNTTEFGLNVCKGTQKERKKRMFFYKSQ